MANEIHVKELTLIVWADTTDYAGDGGTRTHQIDLTSLANTAARQGAKADFGATRADLYSVTLRIEADVAPASGEVIKLFFAPSLSTTAATANPGGVSGADAGYTGTAGDSLDDSIKQLDFIGALTCVADIAPVVQQQTWKYSPPLRYGSPVVYNQSGQALEGDAIEMSISFTPSVPEIQD